MLNVKNLAEIQKQGNQTLNILIYGQPGTGKTTLASSVSKLGKTLLIDSEAGSKFIKEEFAGNIDYLKLEKIEQLDEVLKKENIKEYKAIIIDSISDVLKRMIDKVKGTKETPQLQDWSKIIGGLETYFRHFRDLDKHCILVALSQDHEDEGIILQRPLLAGKSLPQNVCGYMDIVLYLTSDKQNKRHGFVQPTEKYYAKDRSGMLGDNLVDEQLNIQWISERCLITPKSASKEQLERVSELVKELKLDNDAKLKAAFWVGAIDLKVLNCVQAEKIIGMLEKKLSLAN
jgi:phage nucleotide-binding protein